MLQGQDKLHVFITLFSSLLCRGTLHADDSNDPVPAEGLECLTVACDKDVFVLSISTDPQGATPDKVRRGGCSKGRGAAFSHASRLGQDDI